MKRIEDYVVSIPDFPEPGIIFRDVTSVIQDAEDGMHVFIEGKVADKSAFIVEIVFA